MSWFKPVSSFFNKTGRDVSRAVKKSRLDRDVVNVARSKIQDYGSGLYTSGRGAYKTRKYIPRTTMSAVRGRGSYTSNDATHANNLFKGGNGPSPPMFSQVRDETGAIIVSHREYVSDVFAPGVTGGNPVGFQNNSWAINPGVEKTFPWLSQVAVNFEEYELFQCIFLYRSVVSDIGASSNGQVGTVVAVTNYNPAAQAFTDKQSMELYAHAHSCKTTEHMKHGVECDPTKNSGSRGKYIRGAPVGANEDIKSYDHGTFQLALSGVPSSFNGLQVGELWIQYSVKLSKPKLSSGRGYNISMDRFLMCPATTSALTYYNAPLGGIQGDAKNLVATRDYLGYELENSLGCKLSAGLLSGGVDISGKGASGNFPLCITFPSSYTGFVEVTLRLSVGTYGSPGRHRAYFCDRQQVSAVPTATMAWNATDAVIGGPAYGLNDGSVSTTASTTVSTTFVETFESATDPVLNGSNIIGIYDIYGQDGIPTWQSRSAGDYGYGDDMFTTVHLFVAPSNNGADNVIRFYGNTPSGGTIVNNRINRMHLIINEYNPRSLRTASDRTNYYKLYDNKTAITVI